MAPHQLPEPMDSDPDEDFLRDPEGTYWPVDLLKGGPMLRNLEMDRRRLEVLLTHKLTTSKYLLPSYMILCVTAEDLFGRDRITHTWMGITIKRFWAAITNLLVTEGIGAHTDDPPITEQAFLFLCERIALRQRPGLLPMDDASKDAPTRWTLTKALPPGHPTIVPLQFLRSYQDLRQLGNLAEEELYSMDEAVTHELLHYITRQGLNPEGLNLVELHSLAAEPRRTLPRILWRRPPGIPYV